MKSQHIATTSSIPSQDNIKDILKGVVWPSSVTELHVHLGGSVPLHRLWEMAIDRGIRGLGGDYQDFINLVKIQDGKVNDLDSYLEVYDRVELIQSGPQAVRESVIIAIHRAYRTGGMLSGDTQNNDLKTPLFHIGKLELRFNPLKRTGAVFLKGKHAGLYDVDRVIKAACDAVQEVQLAFKNSIKVGLIFCFGRDMTFEANSTLAKKTAIWCEKSSTIVGVDLAGSESADPLDNSTSLSRMKTIFDYIPNKLGRTLHVGETKHVTVETFLRTLESLQPQRVAHPIVAFRATLDDDDDRGLRALKKENIGCEFCVKSNLLTGAVKAVAEYRDIVSLCEEYGIKYCFSTDGPSLQGTSLADELVMLLQHNAINANQLSSSFEAADAMSFLI
jgi:adenosine deaminase